ncbi:hypothetical protein [Idiomarina abyssalis]|uniref:Uncharacterized protein n=1 Tax=Idiomarina abyssalis TaxID=86102 RepID=A0A8I1GD99_9GAMM|nr:hypothetical protein [Idiomarina abyssalis]MBJ7265504.1 hypothetical protein [Idiomarina abyssalis]MBJ7316822.1 hypothetical protein [Idiomarina abyssalis]
MKAKQPFIIENAKLSATDQVGDGYITDNEVIVYTGSAHSDNAGFIAMLLMCDGPLRVKGVTPIKISHPLTNIGSAEVLAAKWVEVNRPSDVQVEIQNWLEGIGLKDHEARRIFELFLRYMMIGSLSNIQLNFKQKSQLQVVSSDSNKSS